MEFNSFKMKDVILDIFSGGTPRTRTPEYWGGELPWLSSGETRSRYLTNTEKTITTKGVKESSTKLAKKDSIVIASAGQGYTRGQTSYLLESMYINQSVIAIQADENKILSKYLFYNISNRYRELRHISDSSSSRGSLTTKILKDLPVEAPSLNIQYRIVNFIDAVDSKIELNTKTIANLEELSQTLFKRWFVDFEFPDENGNPFKSSGGKLVDSELGDIPEGWEVKQLKNLAHHKKDTFNPNKTLEEQVYHFSLPAYDSGEIPVIEQVSEIKSNKWFIDKNCVLFSKMNPRTMRVWLTDAEEETTNVCSTEFVVLESDSSRQNSFIYNVCKSDNFAYFLQSNATGSTNSRQRIRPNIALDYKLAININVMEELAVLLEPYTNKIIALRKEISSLKLLRETVLPKLMSGEIELPDDLEVEEHAELLQ